MSAASTAFQHFHSIQQPSSKQPSSPILLTSRLTIATHSGVVGFTRTYGVHLPEEGITLNAICPNIVATSISSPQFYEKVKDAGLLVPINNVVDAALSFLDDGARKGKSGVCVEVGPRGTRETSAQEWMDEESSRSMEMIHERARPLH